MLEWKRRRTDDSADNSLAEGSTVYNADTVQRTLTWLALRLRVQEEDQAYPRQAARTRSWNPAEFAPWQLGLFGQEYRWLPVSAQRVYWMVIVIAGMGWRVVIGLVAGLICGHLFGTAAGLVFGTGISLGLHWMFVGRLGPLYRSHVEWIVRGINSGLLTGIGVGMIVGRLTGTTGGLVTGAILSLGLGVPVGLLVRRRFFGSGVLQDLFRASAAVVILAIELLVALIVARGVLVGLVLGLCLGTILAPVIGFLGAWGQTQVLEDLFDATGLDVASPWRLTWSIKRAIMLWCLQMTRYVPTHLDRFLAYAADRVLLVKVGAGYNFFHPLLRDYFADRTQERDA
jgi:hypothetical protein